MGRKLEVHYCHQSAFSTSWATGSQRFNDWYDFADWLKQELLKGHPVLITNWEYV